MVNMGELFEFDFISNQEMERVDLTPSELINSGLEDGDLLFGRRSLVESGAGKCSIVIQPDEPLSFESSIIRVRPDREKISATYLYYFFRSPGGRARIAAIVSGVNVKGIRSSNLAKILIDVPEERTQTRISDVLGTYDNLIANNRRRIELLERSARLLFEEWFVRLRYPGHAHDKITDGVPKRWSKKTLGEIAACNVASHTARSLPEEINYIDISSVSAGLIVNKTRMMAAEAPGRARRIAADGDVIWSNVRPNLRQYALVCSPDERDVFSTGFTVMTPRLVPFSFLYVGTTTDAFVAHLVNHTTGASYPAVRPADFERAQILVPTDALLRDFHEQCEPMLRLIPVLQKQSRAAEQARDLLLPRLMDGRIAV